MPRTSSAKKALRGSLVRRARNYTRRTRIKSAEKALLDAVESGAADAKEKFAAAVQAVDRALKRKIIHRNTAARRKAQLAKAMKKIAK